MGVIIYNAISILFFIIYVAIIIRAFLSWFPINRSNPIFNLIGALTEPILGPIRNMISKSPIGRSGMMIDFSPIFAIFLLDFIKNILRSILL